MRLVAILAIRNERPYLANCLNHLIDNGVDYVVIDNESTDGTAELLRQPHFARGLVSLQTHAYPGHFDWVGLMQAREAAARDIEADWVVFVSADEVMHSYVPGETLSEAVARVAAGGADVIDFNEFVFVPTDRPYQVDHAGMQPLHHYYFFEPSRPRLMRARRRDLAASHIAHGGHVLTGGAFRLAEESFALRHYIFRDQAHAYSKYIERVFAQGEVERGWHGNRIGFAADCYTLPAADTLHRLSSPQDRDLRRDQPRKAHFWDAQG